jgi:RNA-directed DNA polymerase
MLAGWANYFGYGTRWRVYRELDHHVWTRVRRFLQRRHQVPTRGTRRFRAEVVFGPLGVLRLQALP